MSLSTRGLITSPNIGVSGSGVASDLLSHDLLQLRRGALDLVVHHHVPELLLGRELQLSRPQPLVDRLAGIRPPALQTLAKRPWIRGGDEHLDRLRHRRAHLARPLDLDLEHHRHPVGEPALDLGAQGPVAIAAVGRVLEELARMRAGIEVLTAQEVVVAAVHLTLARLPRGRRDRELEAWDPPQELGDQRPLAHPRRPGDHEDLRHGPILTDAQDSTAASTPAGALSRPGSGPETQSLKPFGVYRAPKASASRFRPPSARYRQRFARLTQPGATPAL